MVERVALACFGSYNKYVLTNGFADDAIPDARRIIRCMTENFCTQTPTDSMAVS